MFKLVKINGSKTNVPEITTFKIDGSASYKAGAIYFINNGTLSTEQAFSYDIKFIPIETIPENSGKTIIHGFIVNSDMVFETEICSLSDSVQVGDLISACFNDPDSITHVEDALGEEALLLCKDGVEKTNKVLVALKW